MADTLSKQAEQMSHFPLRQSHSCLHALLVALLIWSSQSAHAVSNLLYNPGFDNVDSGLNGGGMTPEGDGWTSFSQAGFGAVFGGSNGHASFFAHSSGNSGGVFQSQIPATEGSLYQFDLLDTRIEANFHANLQFGLEFYASNDQTLLLRHLVPINTTERLALPNVDSGGSVNGASFSTRAIAPAGASFVRPVVRFNQVNPSYSNRSNASVFVFESYLAEIPAPGGELLKNPGIDENLNYSGTLGQGWGLYGDTGFGDLFAGGGNPHMSFFAGDSNASGGVFQRGILTTSGQPLRFTLGDVRIETDFDAQLFFGIQYYTSDDFTKIGEDVVLIDAGTTGDGLFFSMDSVAPSGAVFARPVVFFHSVNPLYNGQSNANAFVFEASLIDLTSTTVLGDYDRDSDVDFQDYSLWVEGFGATVFPGTGPDGNGDGVVDAADYTVWRDSLTPSSITAAIPEPNALLLVLLASPLVMRLLAR